MKTVDIESTIRGTVQLFGQTAGGWEPCVHTGCDHGHKGPRAAFMFNTDMISFNCFNCSTSAVLNLEATSIPKKFQTVLEDFGMSRRNIEEINFALLSINSHNSGGTKGEVKAKKLDIIPKEIPLPRDFVMLEGNEDTDVGKLAIAELKRRCIDPDDYPFMLCIKASTITRVKWEKRLVIPYFRGDDLIFYQGQDLTKKAEQKYLNASHADIKRARIISNYDVLREKSDEPVYVVEGFYDAYHLNAVAVLGNQLNDGQVAWLNKTYRNKVFIPDRYGDGSDIAIDCLSRGWQISVPYPKGLDSNIKDVSDLVSNYGLLYTMKLIKENTSNTEFDGKIKLATLTK